ncbi:MAG TPA: hypothetical protein PK737_01555, partial [Bacilli bacterium]|nr:hypothetical protein [Bacilli bacterium]
MVFKESGIKNSVLPVIDQSKKYLGIFNVTLSSVSIPTDFSASYVLRNSIPGEINNIIDTLNSLKNWLNTKVTDMNNVERKNQQLLSDFKSLFSKFNITVDSLLTNDNVDKPSKASESSTSSVGSTIASKTKSIISNIGDWASEKFNDIKELGTQTWDNVKSTVVDQVESFKTHVEDTGAKIVSGAKSAFNDVIDWSKDRLEDLKDIGAVVWKHIKSIGASIANLLISITKGLCQFIETLIDLIAMIGTGVASIFTGLYDAYQAINGAITGEEWSSSTKAMWKGVMGFVAEDHVGNVVADMYKDTAFGQWLDNNAYSPFKSDGMACKIGSGIGYVTGIIILTIVTVGAGGAAV